MTGRELLADGILVLTAMIWGTGFVVMKIRWIRSRPARSS